MAPLHLINIFTLIIAAVVVILPAQLAAYYTSNTGCHHNGTWYAEKSLVPTTEKCLNCLCSKKTLVCRLKVCPEMPMPPPRGCVVVQKKNTCCAYLSCARLDAYYKIPSTRRVIAYLDHYERESIDRAVNENMPQRRSDDTEVDLYVCVKNGTVYKSGSAMSSSNLCSYCYCIGGKEKCVKPKCMLPVEGCKAIFVDSTCCPVRYDCSIKQTGKSSQEVRYRKTSNKHYMRMSQRLQRNRGCTVGQNFYAEGQKMKPDNDMPCDICFCIRGQRKCAPKKCAPSLRNCIPVVPKGQCCPSSYDCGMQRDYKRSQNSRQFNVLSFIFGKDADHEAKPKTEIAVQYPLDRHPEVVERPLKAKPDVSASEEQSADKSIFDTLREGLEFIDNNNNKMWKDNLDLIGVQPSPIPIPLGQVHGQSTTTEVSFLDLLLAPSETNSEENSSKESLPEEKTSSTSSAGLSWVDLILDLNEEEEGTSTVSDKIDINDTSTLQDLMDFDATTSIDRIDSSNFTESGEQVGVLNADVQDAIFFTTTDAVSTPDTTQETAEATQTLPTTLTETTEEMISTKSNHTNKVGTTNHPTEESPITSKSVDEKSTTENPSTVDSIHNISTPNKTDVFPLKVAAIAIGNVTHVAKPEKGSNFLTALLDDLSEILGNQLNSSMNSANQTKNNKTATNKTSSHELPIPHQLPLFKPLSTDKTYSRINSKLANLTINPAIVSTKVMANTTFKPLPTHLSKNPSIPIWENMYSASATKDAVTSKPSSTSSFTTISSAQQTSTSTLNSVKIKTNPTILESEPLDQNIEPTLPPSLPNLKIIPFLPTDAVKSDHQNSQPYEYYHSLSGPISRNDYDQYDDANIYPSITEKYPLYSDLEDGSKAEYIYKFNVEGPDSLVSSTSGKFDGTLGSPAFVKYDLSGAGLQAPKGFSPPTKTEGGFLPKESLILDNEHDNVKPCDGYQVTQHIIDITTSGDISNTTKVIEITTPDPFKDVIRTELPPDLISLIEDKLKSIKTKANTTTALRNDNMPDKASEQLHSKSSPTQVTMASKGNEKTDDKANLTNAINGTKDHLENSTYNDASTELTASDDASIIPPFKSLPQAVIKQLDKESTPTPTIHTETTPVSILSENVKDKPTNPISASKNMLNRRVSAIKHNHNKTIAANTTPRTTTSTSRQQLQQPQLKITKNHLANQSTMNSKIVESSYSAVSTTTKSKNTVNRRVTSAKPTKQYKATHRPPIITTAAATTKKPATSAHPVNAASIDVYSSIATKRTEIATNSRPKTTTTTTTSTQKTTTTTTTRPSTVSMTSNPFLNSPFDKLPFMDASFNVKYNTASPTISTATISSSFVSSYAETSPTLVAPVNHAKLMGHTLNQPEGLEPSFTRPQQNSVDLNEYSKNEVSTSSDSSVVGHSTAKAQQQHLLVNNLIDPSGILKLAGCNIYGRMYRVGRIIVELSSPCLECKCTEIGVKCSPLDC